MLLPSSLFPFKILYFVIIASSTILRRTKTVAACTTNNNINVCVDKLCKLLNFLASVNTVPNLCKKTISGLILVNFYNYNVSKDVYFINGNETVTKHSC